jgi:acetoin utilization deacetylase AcuC-like enzyme
VALTIFTSDRFADHLNPPGHPERVERAETMQVVAARFRQRGGAVVEPRPVTDEELARVHDRDYLTMIRETAGRAVALDPDTFTSPESYDVARLAAGAAISAVEHVLDNRGTSALAMVRPPGHHAERNRAMGFCLFNNIAVAAAHARAAGVQRVAVVDYDVHHGNGTQSTFYEDPSVLFISSHQFPFYPGTGAAGDVGAEQGLGFTANFPLEAGATDADYERVYAAAVAPILRQFRPELLLVSAGFDAHTDDPLGGMRVTTAEYARLTALLALVADECCGGRIAAVTEGGYDLRAIASSLEASIDALHGRTTLEAIPAPQGPTPRAEACLAAVRPHVGKYWTV